MVLIDITEYGETFLIYLISYALELVKYIGLLHGM